jgi:hypothetical protein
MRMSASAAFQGIRVLTVEMHELLFEFSGLILMNIEETVEPDPRHVGFRGF